MLPAFVKSRFSLEEPGGLNFQRPTRKIFYLDAIKNELAEQDWDGCTKNGKDKSSALLEVFYDMVGIIENMTVCRYRL